MDCLPSPHPPVSLWTFAARAIGWFLLAALVWMQVSVWTSYPVAGIAHIILGNGAKDWVRSIHKEPGLLQVETRVRVATPAQAHRNGVTELVVEVNPAHNAYGLPLFFSLLLASGGRHFIQRALAGYIILLIPQTFTLVFQVLKEIMVLAGDPAALEIAQWQMEGIALGFQLGTLILPTLAPVVVWLWLDRTFFSAVIVDGWLRNTTTE